MSKQTTWREKYRVDKERYSDGMGNWSEPAKKTSYGYSHVRGTPYICIYKTRIYVYEDGFAKSVTRVDKNYHPPYQFTTYWNADGTEIVSQNNSTRAELNIWKTLREHAAKEKA